MGKALFLAVFALDVIACGFAIAAACTTHTEYGTHLAHGTRHCSFNKGVPTVMGVAAMFSLLMGQVLFTVLTGGCLNCCRCVDARVVCTVVGLCSVR